MLWLFFAKITLRWIGSMRLIRPTAGGESCLQDPIWSYPSWESEEIYRAIRRFNMLFTVFCNQ